MAKRKSVGKKVRFEVFKRDQFACQYCGATPPSTILEIDHVLPVSKGGDNDEANLVTSCRECNQGKAGNALTEMPRPLDEQIKEKRERSEQVAAYNSFLADLRDQKQATINRLGAWWYNLCRGPKQRRNRFVFGQSRRSSINCFLRYLTETEIVEMMDVAHGRLPVRSYEQPDEQTWKYFCGCCWREIKGSD